MRPVDLRSDTVTRPTAAMREAMASAVVGDDVFDDDPTVHALQQRAAAVLGKQAALFVPSGTMANQIAVRLHTRAGDEAIVHAKSHIMNYEAGGAAALSGVTLRCIDSADGALPADAVRTSLHVGDDPHLAPTRLVCLEDTHNGCGGCVLPDDARRNVESITAEHGIALHLDGARIWNAAIARGVPIADRTAGADTVSACFSKGLGAPVGSVIAGSNEHVARARRIRKMFGGGMRQAGILAAAALHALEHHVDRLADDHRRARAFAGSICELAGVRLRPDDISTNLVYFGLDPAHAMAQLDGGGTPALVHALAEHGVWITGSATRYRAVFHLNVDDDGLERAVAAFTAVLGA